MPHPSLAFAEPLLRDAVPNPLRWFWNILLLLTGFCCAVLTQGFWCPHSTVHVEQQPAITTAAAPALETKINDLNIEKPSPPGLFEVDSTSVTLAWSSIHGASKYAVEYRPAGNQTWKLLSDKLSTPFMRKKNLASGTAFEWRIAGLDTSGLLPWSQTAVFSTLDAGMPQLEPPRKHDVDAESVTLQWDASPGNAHAYTLQMWAEGDVEWTTASETIKSTASRKKGLHPGEKYAFRVKPTASTEAGATPYAFSRASEWIPVMSVSPFMKEIFGSDLVDNAGSAVDIAKLGGKVVAVYFSASW